MIDFTSRRQMLKATSLASLAQLFSRAGQAEHARKDMRESLLKYASSVAPSLFRDASGILKYPSLSPSQPGRAYSTQLWDWDTLWTAVGLFRIAKLNGDNALHTKTCLHLQGSLNNFLDHQSTGGRIPIMISTEAADFFQSTTPWKHNPHNQAKPVLAQMALLLADESGDASWFAAHVDKVLAFYEAWTNSNLSRIGLLVWGNDVAIGTDNDPTTFGRPEFSSASIFLNCFYYQDLRAAATLARRIRRKEIADRLDRMAQEVADAIQRYCWDDRDGFYYTVDVQCEDQRSRWLPGLDQGMPMSWSALPLKIQTVAGFLPLWCGIATETQAKKLITRNYLADDRFRAPFGVRSLSRLEPMYSLAPHSGNPSNWLGPIWIVSNYWVWNGLKRYGFAAEARELATKTVDLLSRDVTANQTMNEYYHPDGGSPLSHRGFIDWNLLILAMNE